VPIEKSLSRFVFLCGTFCLLREVLEWRRRHHSPSAGGLSWPALCFV
jgi:hypothetical protein